MADIIPGFEETDADRAYWPVAGCCAECDETLEDVAAWERELSGGEA